MHRRIARAATTTAAVTALLAPLAACSSGHSRSSVIPTSTRAGGTATPAKAGGAAASSGAAGKSAAAGGVNNKLAPPPAFAGTQHALPTKITNVPALYKTVRLNSCTATATGWSATGTATNTTTDTVVYRVLVLFTDPQARDLDSAVGSVTASPGKPGTWVAKQSFKAPKGTHCVVRAVTKGA